MDDAARNADAVEDAGGRESIRNGGRRTRRPTNGGTAFAAAVTVEDSPAPAVVVPVAPEVTEPAPDAGTFLSVAATTGDATATDDSEAPVRRTRTGPARRRPRDDRLRPGTRGPRRRRPRHRGPDRAPGDPGRPGGPGRGPDGPANRAGPGNLARRRD